MYKAAFIYLGTEHAEFKVIQQALAEKGVAAELIHLDAIQQYSWQEYDFVSIRMCRGLHLYPEFTEKIQDLCLCLQAVKEKNIVLANPLSIVKVGIDKAFYLKTLEQQGVELIPTRWIDAREDCSVQQIMAETGWDKVVLKPTVSTLSWQTYFLEKNASDIVVSATANQADSPFKDNLLLSVVEDEQFWLDPEEIFQQLKAKNNTLMLQQFMPDILSGGELSFVFIDGVFSHAVRKLVAEGGWLAHEVFGGCNNLTEVSTKQINWAEAVYRKITQLYGELLYGRVDAIADEQGKLKLLECELIVPRLFLHEGQAVDKYIAAILKNIQ